MKKLSLLMAVLLLTMTFLSACSKKTDGTPTSGDGAPTKDVLTVAMNSEPSTLDGNGKNDSASLQTRAQIYNTLIAQNEDMEIIPAIAEKWEYRDETTLVFTIRQGVKFHDGSTLTAEDVRYSIQRANDIGFASSALSALDFPNCTTEGDYTYIVKLKHAFAPVLANLTDASAAIVPKKVVEENGADYLAANPCGTGPYKLKTWARGDRIELERFDDYWGEKAKIKNVTMRFITETANRAIEVESGGVDIAYDIAPNDIARLQKADKINIVRDNNLSTTYIGFNTQKAPFTDANVRKAIGMALDWSSIVDAVYFGVGSKGQNVIAPSVWGFSENVKPLPYDVEGAKKLLADAGFPTGFTTKIWTSNSQARTDIAEIMQNQLKTLGIMAEVKVLEWGNFLEAVENKETDIFILGATASSGDADALFDQFYSKGHFSGNTVYYQSKVMDDLLFASQKEIDPDKRLKILEEIQMLAIEDAPWIPVWHGEVLTGVSKSVQGFKNHPTNFHNLSTVSFG